MKASLNACNAEKYLLLKTKHTRSNRKERNVMLALPNSHRKLCTRIAKDNGTIGRWLHQCLGGAKLVAPEERRGEAALSAVAC